MAQYGNTNRGLSYRQLGQYERAMQDYDEAIRLDPGSAEARNNSGSPANPRSVEHPPRL